MEASCGHPHVAVQVALPEAGHRQALAARDVVLEEHHALVRVREGAAAERAPAVELRRARRAQVAQAPRADRRALVDLCGN